MSSLPGGPADKAGAIHEALWGVHALLEVLNGRAEFVRVEPPGVDGAEFLLKLSDGREEYWQAKRQLLSQQTWTLQALDSAGVLGFFLQQLRANQVCVFASITDAPDLRVLSEHARAAANHAEFMTQFLGGGRQARFDQLRGIWGDLLEAEVFELLRRVRVEGGHEVTLETMLSRELGATYSGPGRTTLDCLRTLYLDSLHRTLRAGNIREHLAGRGISPRTVTVEDSLYGKLEAITQTYIAGQRAKLIRGEVIPRQVAIDAVAKIQGGGITWDMLLTGAAGEGKSGCLLQAVEGLRAIGMPVLAFRLDRLQPTPTPQALGTELGLPESPAVVLGRCYPDRPVALVLDQLDVVSSTSGRHPDFFDTVAALVEEVRGLRPRTPIHLILACRQFDFEHDHRLRGLLPPSRSPFPVGQLAETEVHHVLAAAKGDPTRLSPRQVELLKLPQNLALFVEAKLVHATQPGFASQKDLFDHYWTAKRQEVVERRPAEAGHWLPVIRQLTREMSERQELSVPKARLDEFTPQFLAALSSAGVLNDENNRYGFGHESFFDYCFARMVVGEGQDFVAFLEADEQHLFRRAQTRQVLAYLRDEDRPRYTRTLDALLTSPGIRAHLKVLVVELVAAMDDPDESEWEVIWPFLSAEFEHIRHGTEGNDKIAARVWQAFFTSRTLFTVADRLGYVERWLNSGESRLEDRTVAYLRWQKRTHGDRAAELLEPFVGCGGEWPLRLRFMMETGDLERSRQFFDLFLRLLDDGTLDEARSRFAMNGTFWSMLTGLVEARPDWCAEVAAHWLDRQLARALANPTEQGEPGVLDLHDDAGLNDLFQSARGAPEAFLTHVLPAVLRVADTLVYPGQEAEARLPRDRLWGFHMGGDYISLSEAYVSACETAFEELVKVDPERLIPFITSLRAFPLDTANHLLTGACLCAPKRFADEALALLADEPERLHCGYVDSGHWRSRCLIEKCSPHCSAETFSRLEAVVLAYATPYERTMDGFKARGYASFTLLSALAPVRLSRTAVRRLGELRRKFGEPEPPRGMRSYTVESPVRTEAATRMSDQSWLRAINKHRLPRGAPDRLHLERGGAWELAGVLGELTAKEPERFGRLALQLPADADGSYFMNVLYKLREADVPAALKIDVARRVFSRAEDTACLMAAADLLGRLGAEELPADAVAFLNWAATEHPDPEGERWLPPPGGGVASHGGDMLNHGVNTVRGHAAEAIRDLILKRRSNLELFLPAIERLVGDRTLAVRACAASTLLAVGNHDVELASSLFRRLVEGQDDRLLASRHAQDFIRRGLRDRFPELRAFVERMLGSDHDAVRNAGARLVCLAHLQRPDAGDLMRVLTGDAVLRLGVAIVASRNLPYAECRGWCAEMLAILFDDEEPAVRQKAAECFGSLGRHPNAPLEDHAALIARFLDSRAFAESPAHLLHTLEGSQQRLPEVVLNVCERFVARCAPGARDFRTSLAADEHTVDALVFSAYAQMSRPALRARALVLIDRMCEEGLNSAGKHLADSER